MSAFVAAEAVEPLDWDFTAYIPGAQGTIPEPSQAKLDAYARTLMGVFATLNIDLPASASEDDIAAALNDAIGVDRKMSEVLPEIEELTAKIRKARIKAASGVCSGHPTIEEITKLPPRVREAFLGWVAGWATDESGEDPTRPHPVVKPSLALSSNGVRAT